MRQDRTTAAHKTLVRALFQAFNDGNLTALPDFFDPTFLHHSPAPGQPRGIAGLRQLWCQLRGQFPDVGIELHDLVAEGNRVVARGTCLSGGGPLGHFLEVFQIADGRITDVWNILTFDRGWVEYGSVLWLQR